MRKLLIYSIAFVLLLTSCQSKSQQKFSALSVHLVQEKSANFTQLDTNGDSYLKGDLKILTWNIQHLGRTKNAQEILQIAKIIKDFDIIAIQEVVGKDPKGAQAVAKIWDVLNRMGSKWDYSISNPTKSPSANMSERYAYLWKTSKIKLLHKPYLDSQLEGVCIREPYIAQFEFKKNKTSFFLINVHARVHNQQPEKEIAYFKAYPKRLQSENIFILGDFNLDEGHSVWNALYSQGFKSSIQNAPTTLKRKCKNGKYLNHSIDNIYYNSLRFNFLNAGRIDFVGDCENLASARLLSDHLPVFLEFEFSQK